MANIIVLLREESSLSLLENGTASVGGLQVGELGYNEASQEFSYKNRVSSAFRHITTREKMLLGAAAATSGAKGVGYFPASGLTSVTVQDALDELRTQVAAAGDGSGYVINGTSQQPTSNFNISGAGVIGTTLGVGGITTLGNTLQRTIAGEFLIQNTYASGGTIKLQTTSGDITLSPATNLQLTPGASFKVSVNNTNDATSISTGSLITTGGVGIAKALWVGGLVNIAGNIATSGSTINASASIKIGTTGLTGVVQYGINADLTFNSSATSNCLGIFTKITTAPSITTAQAAGLYIESNTKGAGATLNTNYGIYIGDQSGVGTTNWAIYSGGGDSFFSGNLFIGTVASLKMNVATPAGGAIAANFGSSAHCGIAWGSGAPTVSAPKGCLYLRTDGSATNNRAYINTDGGTTWTALTTAA